MPMILIAIFSILSSGLSGGSGEPGGPVASAAVQPILEESERFLVERKNEEALAAADRAMEASRGVTDEPGMGQALRARSRALEAMGRLDEALAAWRAAAEIWKQLAARPERIEALCVQALLSIRLGRGQDATDLVEEAVVLASQKMARPLVVVRALNKVADQLWRTGGMREAERLARQALVMGETHAPGSLDVAYSLNNLGNVAYSQGDLDAARDYLERARAIREKRAPGSLEVAASLYNLGNVALSQGDLGAAKDYCKRSLTIRELHAPGSLDVARSLNNLGAVAGYQGDLTASKDYFERGLAIQEQHAPGSLDVARSLNNLGEVARRQGDFGAARSYYERSLVIKEKYAPGSLSVGLTLNNLGAVAGDQGEFAIARDYFERSLVIKEKYAPGSLDVAASLEGLGAVANYQGDLKSAKDYLEHALEIRDKHAPGSLQVAASLNNLGIVVQDQGDLVAAKDLHVRALMIREKQAPGSLDVAGSFNNLGTVTQDEGDLGAAEGFFARAWAIAREQRRSIVGDEAGRAFTAANGVYAANLVQAQLALGRIIEAFQSLEEGRAQALLQLLSERGLARAGIDADLWRRYEVAEGAFQKAGKDLAEVGAEEARLERDVAKPGGSGAGEAELAAARRKREEALSAYTRARLEQENLLGEVRRAVPGLAPRAFTFEDARRALPRDSVYVAFSLGEKEGAIFVILSDPERAVQAHKIPLGEKDLAGRVAALRERIGTDRKGRGVGGLVPVSEPARGADAELIAASRELFQALFPAEARAAIEATQRVVVSPDGPLWELPFAALVTNLAGKPEWLGLERPLSYTPSLTVLALERERGPSTAGASGDILVVGDPIYVRAAKAAVPKPTAVAQAQAPSTSSATLLRGERSYIAAGGIAPERLPASAVEAQRISALYGVEPLIGEAASEAAVRRRLSHAAIVHLATHGYFQPTLAMSSGVLLTPPDDFSIERTDDDGALQAWELGSTLPLSAELVVLSACETGRGEKVRGEGLVGLTRAFQAAGARSVVATHWKVADESTAEVMVSFHKALRGGVLKDEALRRAMAEAASKRGTQHPFFWAPFFLTGNPDSQLQVGRPAGE